MFPYWLCSTYVGVMINNKNYPYQLCRIKEHLTSYIPRCAHFVPTSEVNTAL